MVDVKVRNGAGKEFGSLQHLDRRAERRRDTRVQRLADHLHPGVLGQDAAVVVRRHLELALFVQAAAVLAIHSFNKLTSVIIKVFSEIAIHGFCPLKELDEEGAKDDEELKSSEGETGLGQVGGGR